MTNTAVFHGGFPSRKLDWYSLRMWNIQTVVIDICNLVMILIKIDKQNIKYIKNYYFSGFELGLQVYEVKRILVFILVFPINFSK